MGYTACSVMDYTKPRKISGVLGGSSYNRGTDCLHCDWGIKAQIYTKILFKQIQEGFSIHKALMYVSVIFNSPNREVCTDVNRNINKKTLFRLKLYDAK